MSGIDPKDIKKVVVKISLDDLRKPKSQEFS